LIEIHPSPTADTRTCDFSQVTKDTLFQSSLQHIHDVRQGFAFLKKLMDEAAYDHDYDKLTAIDHFHSDFTGGFAETGWWDNHRKVNRHHLLQPDGVPEDVNLIDVLDLITDCVMAGMARSGSVYAITIPPEILQRAFDNTVDLLKRQVVVTPAE
jgi:hypothetical protein